MEQIPDDLLEAIAHAPLPADAVPDGWYLVQLTDLHIKASPVDGPKLTLTYTVVEGEYAGAELPQHLGSIVKNKGKVRSSLAALGLESQDLNALRGSRDYGSVAQVHALHSHWESNGQHRASISQVRPLQTPGAQATGDAS